MIAVAADERAQILLVPIGEEQVIITGAFGLAPHIESLVHDDETHTVAQVQKLGRGRVMAGANGVATDGFQQLKLAFPRAQVERGAERAEIVVQADAIDWQTLTV